VIIWLSAQDELRVALKDDPRFIMWGGFSPSEEDGTSVDVNASVGEASGLAGSRIGAKTVLDHGSVIVLGLTAQTLS
jgi:hypothetical protein